MEAPPLVTLTFGLLVLPLASLPLPLLPCVFDQVHLIDVLRRSSPRRSFRKAAVDDLVLDTREAVQGCSGPQQVLRELGILQVLVRDCDLEILGYLLVRDCSVRHALLHEHLEVTLQLVALREDVAHDIKEHPCTSSVQSRIIRVM